MTDYEETIRKCTLHLNPCGLSPLSTKAAEHLPEYAVGKSSSYLSLSPAVLSLALHASVQTSLSKTVIKTMGLDIILAICDSAAEGRWSINLSEWEGVSLWRNCGVWGLKAVLEHVKGGLLNHVCLRACFLHFFPVKDSKWYKMTNTIKLFSFLTDQLEQKVDLCIFAE